MQFIVCRFLLPQIDTKVLSYVVLLDTLNHFFLFLDLVQRLGEIEISRCACFFSFYN